MPSELSKATAHLVVRPPSFKVEIAGEEFVIKPLPNAEVELIADAIGEIVTGLHVVINATGEIDTSRIRWGEIAPVIALVIKILGPSLPRIIAASLRVDESFVIDNVFTDNRVDIAQLIFEAEGIKHLLGKLQGLAGNTLPKTADPEPQNSTPLEPTQPSPGTTPDTSSTRSAKPSQKSKSSG